MTAKTPTTLGILRAHIAGAMGSIWDYLVAQPWLLLGLGLVIVAVILAGRQ